MINENSNKGSPAIQKTKTAGKFPVTTSNVLFIYPLILSRVRGDHKKKYEPQEIRKSPNLTGWPWGKTKPLPRSLLSCMLEEKKLE